MALANAADPLGYDVKIGEDLDPGGRSASGLELVTDGMLHRLTCGPKGTLLQTGAPDDQVEFGEDVRLWLNGAITQDALNARAPRLEEVLRRDPRLADVAVTLTVSTGDSAARWGFFIGVRGVTIRGETIDRIVGVSLVTVEFLAQGR